MGEIVGMLLLLEKEEVQGDTGRARGGVKGDLVCM
jgi:hypothetical protein